MKILNRKLLQDEYNSILSESGLKKLGTGFKGLDLEKTLVVQSTSGSQGHPLLIPRLIDDVTDIALRVLKHYKSHFDEYPTKIGMIGGISHVEAATSLNVGRINIRHFDQDSFEDLLNWQPEVITCYPSVLRELIFLYGSNLKFVKAVKVGGEKLFPSDCERIFRISPGALVIEQYGSTELPALAIRSFSQASFKYEGIQIQKAFTLQKERFTFLEIPDSGWKPIIAKDNFSNLAFKLREYYDIGDEGYWKSGDLYDVRRATEPEFMYWETIERFLKMGFINAQISLSNSQITVHGDIQCNSELDIEGKIFSVKRGQVVRLTNSKKVPLVIK